MPAPIRLRISFARDVPTSSQNSGGVHTSTVCTLSPFGSSAVPLPRATLTIRNHLASTTGNQVHLRRRLDAHFLKVEALGLLLAHGGHGPHQVVELDELQAVFDVIRKHATITDRGSPQ